MHPEAHPGFSFEITEVDREERQSGLSGHCCKKKKKIILVEKNDEGLLEFLSQGEYSRQYQQDFMTN